MKILSEALKVNATLIHLDLACTQENDSIIVICNPHCDNPLIDNNVGKEGVNFLSEALKLNSALMHLYLEGTQRE